MSAQPKEPLSAEEALKLKEENAMLRATLEAFGQQHFMAPTAAEAGDDDQKCDGDAPSPASSPTASNEWGANLARRLNTTEGTTSFYAALAKFVDRPEYLARIAALKQQTSGDDDDDDAGATQQGEGVTNKNYSTRISAVHNSVIVADTQRDGQVGILDLDGVDWWTLVPFSAAGGDASVGSDLSKAGLDAVDFDDHSADAGSTTSDGSHMLDGSYVFVDHEDVVEAMADYVTGCLIRVPATRNLNPEQMQALLAGSFAELKEQGTVTKLWAWGTFAYTTYGWSTTAFNLYRNPTYVMLVCRALWTGCKYASMLLL